jgi:pyruvate dehydrogenase complex dehydrogenase (E1) component
MMERREALGGFVPQRKRKGNPLKTPPLSAFENMLTATGETRNFNDDGVCENSIHPCT